MTAETAVQKHEKAPLSMGAMGFEMTDIEQAYRYAKVVCASGLAPKNETPEGVLIKVEYGHQLGLSNMAAIQNIANINGRPSIFGDAAIGLVRKSGIMELFEERIEGDGDKMTAICRTKRKGEESIHERTFSVEDAKRANLWGKVGPWTQYPKRMLQMRARSWTIRDIYPDVIQGLSIAEEARDIPAVDYIEVTATETPATETSASDKPASKTDELAAKLNLKKGSQIAQPEKATQTPPEPEKTTSEQDTPPPESEKEQTTHKAMPVDEEGNELYPEKDMEEADRLHRAKLITDIEQMKKYKPKSFKGYVGETCENPANWKEELSIGSLQSLYDLLDASK